MSRPLILCDCDEVLLHFVVPFRAWLDEIHSIHFEFKSSFEAALRHKESGDPVEQALVWRLLDTFFACEMDRQAPIAGAVAAMARLAQRADIVILTNIGEGYGPARAAHLAGHGIHAAVRGNRGSKAPAAQALIAAHRPSMVLFIDDLASNHAAIAKALPQAWRLQMVGEPEIAEHIPSAPDAHARIDDWPAAEAWIHRRLDEAARVAA